MDNKKYKNEDLKTVVEHEMKDAKQGSDKQVNYDGMNSMAPTLDEMRQLGKDMEGMKTGKKLKEEGLVPDPVQHDE